MVTVRSAASSYVMPAKAGIQAMGPPRAARQIVRDLASGLDSRFRGNDPSGCGNDMT